MREFLESECDLHDDGVVAAIDDVPLWSAPFGLKLLQSVRLARNLHILDVGSGTGFPIVELSQRLGPTCRAYGVDPWSEAVRRLRHKLRTWQIDNVVVTEAVAEALPFRSATFDLVVSNNGTNNVENEERAFQEIARVAKPGAQLLFTCNLPATMHEFYDLFDALLAARGLSRARERMKQHVLAKRKPLDWTRAQVERVGFEIVEVSLDSFALRFSDGSAMLRHSLIRLAFIQSWRNLLDESDVGDVFDALEEELNARAGREGEISLTVPWACFDCRKAR
ncbi:MAG: class I SAM-dependent methyltransferase [Candidatus Latescibacterota bacterium]|nr:MAG: class I SAM-dependent methyltransferase [Candidatus Latescibacterota bacterium]